VVRPALSEDAAAAVAVLRASITACILDHQNDPSTLARWLENKKVEIFRSWLESGQNLILVAECEGVIAGVGLLANDRNIRLCYVEPSLQGLGVGRALLQALEAAARERGFDAIELTSTHGARSFYERAGFEKSGEPTLAFGVLTSFPFRKRL
jgi:GNAT superfamily N-acetyltransferase